MNHFFPATFNIDERETNITCIKIYGFDKNNKNVCLRIDDFQPYVYLELPSCINWTESKANKVVSSIDDLLKDKKPLRKVYSLNETLYGANIDDFGKYKSFPFLKLYFSNVREIKNLYYKVQKELYIENIGKIKLNCHEDNANPILQLVCTQSISTADWIQFYGTLVKLEDQITHSEF